MKQLSTKIQFSALITSTNFKILQFLNKGEVCVLNGAKLIILNILNRVFPTGGDGGGGSPPTTQKLAHPPLSPGKIPPSRLPPPHQILIPLSLNNNFPNGQNYSSSNSHHPIKKSPHCTALHCNAIPLPLKAI